MKKISLLIVLSGWVLFSTAVQAATYDATGRWNFSVSGNLNNCGEPPEPNESGTAVLIQTANSFLLVFESSTGGTLKTVSGGIQGATYQFSDRFWEDGGWTNDTVTFTLSSPSSGSGSASWNWSDGGYSCSGGYSLSITKQSQSPPVHNASGTWSFVETNFWNNCGESNPASDSGITSISQKDIRFTATGGQGGTWQGFVSGATYTFVDSYAEDDGITSVVCTVDLSSAAQGSGQCWWVWDLDGNSNDHCEGGSYISITRQAGNKSTAMPYLPLLLF
jgi:hypothetical protein